MKVLFVEPPKEMWFVMGEYLPPPFGILQLASYLEEKVKDVEIEVLDCQAEKLDWDGLERRIESAQPDIFAPSALATCNAYLVARAAELAKRVNPEILTVAGGQHFTATAEESLRRYPEIDVIVRGEGEQTLAELVKSVDKKSSLSRIKGISFRHGKEVRHSPDRPLIEDLDSLPLPGYHFVEHVIHKYHFRMMSGANAGYALIEGSRGCPHRCTFCSQWKHWRGKWRKKSARRIADEMELCYRNYGIRFLWLTDDNFGLGRQTRELCQEIKRGGIGDEIMWFMQVRVDDIVKHQDILPLSRAAGLHWALVGVENQSPAALNSFRKKIDPKDAKRAMDLLKKNDIFAQATLIIGNRKDTRESIENLREFTNAIDPDLAIFMILTPFPGTELYEKAKRNGWIEEDNWANYDMVHAIIPTETLTKKEVQEELYLCYRSFYGSFSRRFSGLFSSNRIKRRTYRYLAGQGLLKALRDLFR
ncbi:MAG: B12-binding domain-containing radical SAM protein [Candidatus Hadarchaeum sp.]|uniref:B12-binding domain-containing radical SAM protein n=1 Tax=Candidatus Hadarchaeum sp. TaxID=2883567 RepID=UPI003D0C19C4